MSHERGDPLFELLAKLIPTIVVRVPGLQTSFIRQHGLRAIPSDHPISQSERTGLLSFQYDFLDGQCVERQLQPFEPFQCRAV